MIAEPLSRDFYVNQDDDVRLSARVVVPLVIDLVEPGRVIDVGCGLGTWLSVFRECGVAEILGIDGEHVDRSLLAIPAGCFSAHDLTLPLRME